MKRVVLHIGRQKTGTTAIQAFLQAQTGWLRENGYFYPKTGIKGRGHHLISEPIAQKRALQMLFTRRHKLAEQLILEFDQNTDYTPILSSEAFQNCHPSTVKGLFDGYDCKIIIYLRNQIDYLASAYNQRVHATDYSGSLERYFYTIYSADYLKFVTRWEKQFPKSLVVRKFDRTELINSNVVDDFITNALGLKPPYPGVLGEEDPNPSLNAKVLQFKLHLNKTKLGRNFCRNRLYSALPKLNQDFPAGKLRPPRKIVDHLKRRYEKKEIILAGKYFNSESLFDYTMPESQPVESLTQKELELMKKRLSEIIS